MGATMRRLIDTWHRVKRYGYTWRAAWKLSAPIELQQPKWRILS